MGGARWRGVEGPDTQIAGGKTARKCPEKDRAEAAEKQTVQMAAGVEKEKEETEEAVDAEAGEEGTEAQGGEEVAEQTLLSVDQGTLPKQGRTDDCNHSCKSDCAKSFMNGWRAWQGCVQKCMKGCLSAQGQQ